MAGNTFLYVDKVTNRSLRRLLNRLSIASHFNTDYNKEFTGEYAIGDTLRVKLPQRFITTKGTLTYTPQPISRIYTTVKVDRIAQVGFDYDAFERAVKMERSDEEIDREYINPAAEAIRQSIEDDAAQFAYQNTNHTIGVLGTDPSDFDTTSAAARQRMVEMAAGTEDRCAIVAPSIMRALKKSSVSYFNPVSDLTKQWREGIVGSGDGFDWYESASLYNHAAGVWQTPSAVTVKGSLQSGATLLVNATTGDTFKAGDKFAIALVKNVNPATRRVVGTATKQFTILADVTAAASAATLSISPAIYGPGSQYQNVDALPLDTQVLTLWPGTATPSTGPKSGTVSLFFQRDAFALVGVKLETPKAVEASSTVRDPNSGISLSFVRAFDPIERRMINRLDCVYGFGSLYPDNCAVALAGA